MSLDPPIVISEDPGAHQLDDSSDDHFSDASEGKAQARGHSRNVSSTSQATLSPIPVTRVERVDDEPSHGEVPGTAAYKLRTQDAVPDEIEVVPEGTRSRSTSRLSESDRPATPSSPVPKMVVERVDDKLAHGEVPGTAAYEMRKMDAEPDEVRPASAGAMSDLKEGNRSEVAGSEPRYTYDEYDELNDGTTSENDEENNEAQQAGDDDFGDSAAPTAEEDGDDGFGDDFDDFEVGDQVDDDDFGDFDDGFAEPTTPPAPEATMQAQIFNPLADLPTLSFTDLRDPAEMQATCTPFLTSLFPTISPDTLKAPPPSVATDAILTDRSASLWSQLIAPPPIAPPTWIRSRIRRLFLVSLGVPVDLDEILPASKQKKLILPSIDVGQGRRDSGQIARLKRENGSNTSLGSTATDGTKGEKRGHRKRETVGTRTVPAPPEFDANSASLVAGTTSEAMAGMTDDELKEHLVVVEALVKDAADVLEYWVKRKDSAIGDKEAFEGVIENLVGFVRERREGGKKR